MLTTDDTRNRVIMDLWNHEILQMKIVGTNASMAPNGK